MARQTIGQFALAPEILDEKKEVALPVKTQRVIVISFGPELVNHKDDLRDKLGLGRDVDLIIETLSVPLGFRRPSDISDLARLNGISGEEDCFYAPWVSKIIADAYNRSAQKEGFPRLIT